MFTSAARLSARNSIARRGAQRLTITRVAPYATDASSKRPPHVSTDDNIKYEYRRPTDGKDVGRTSTHAETDSHGSRSLQTFSLQDKVCVITGGARGLGNLFARTFAEAGCNRIAILDLSQEEADAACEDLVQSFIKSGEVQAGEIQALGFGLDVSNEKQVKDAFQSIVDRWGKVTTLVSAAGIVENYSALEYPTERMKKIFDVNVFGSFFCVREAARHMINTDTPGSIIMIASMSADIINVPQAQTPYNASKAAVKHMASSLAVEWAKEGIRVNTISPGYILTPLTQNLLDENAELQDKWVNSTPMGRMGTPDDLKGAIVYLASDASKFTTGTELRIDGGYTIV